MVEKVNENSGEVFGRYNKPSIIPYSNSESQIIIFNNPTKLSQRISFIPSYSLTFGRILIFPVTLARLFEKNKNENYGILERQWLSFNFNGIG
jgi:hypothetical protein